MTRILLLIVLGLAVAPAAFAQAPVRPDADPRIANAAVGEMRDAIKSLRPEGFILNHGETADEVNIGVTGADPAGLMYGVLELAEQIRIYGVDRVREVTRNPYMPMRGTKFNIPLDLRTPSYTDMGDSAQANIPTVWDFGFWTTYLDQLARNDALRSQVDGLRQRLDAAEAQQGAQRASSLNALAGDVQRLSVTGDADTRRVAALAENLRALAR